VPGRENVRMGSTETLQAFQMSFPDERACGERCDESNLVGQEQ
jgi:hypothetical protein